MPDQKITVVNVADRPLDTDAIARRAGNARAAVEGNVEADEYDRFWADAETLILFDVDRLLVELETRHVNSDEGYVRGLRAAGRLLTTFATQPPSGFDKTTCERLRDAVQGMAKSAIERLGVDGADAEETR